MALRSLYWDTRSGSICVSIDKIALRLHRPTAIRHTWVTIFVRHAVVHLSERPAQARSTGAAIANASDPNRFSRQAKQVGKNVASLCRFIALKYVDVEIQDAAIEFGQSSVRITLANTAMSLDFIHLSAEKCVFDEQRPIFMRLMVSSAQLEEENLQKLEVISNLTFNFSASPGGDFGLQKCKLAIKAAGIELPVAVISNIKKIISRGQDSELVKEFKEDQSESQPINLDFLAGIDDAQIHLNSVHIFQSFPHLQPNGIPIVLTCTVKTVEWNVNIIEEASMVHSMFFKKGIIAHQMLATLVGLGINISEQIGTVCHESHEIVNLPLMTVAGKTSTLARWLQRDDCYREANDRVSEANVIFTSPCLDFGTNHIEVLNKLIREYGTARSSSSRGPRKSLPRALIIETLPKINTTYYIHEPACRVFVVDPDFSNLTEAPKGNFGGQMLIATLSSYLFEVNSEHVANNDYSVNFVAKSGLAQVDVLNKDSQKQTIFKTESSTLRVSITSVLPTVAEGTFFVNSFSLNILHDSSVRFAHSLVRMISQKQVQADKLPPQITSRQSLSSGSALMPTWLRRFGIEMREVKIVLARERLDVDKECRGVALTLQSIQTICTSMSYYKHLKKMRSESTDTDTRGLESPAVQHWKESDHGGHVTVESRNLALLLVESEAVWNRTQPIFSAPEAHFGVSSGRDRDGRLRHISMMIPGLLLGLSMHTIYGILSTADTLKAFLPENQTVQKSVTNANPLEDNNRPRHLLVLSLKVDLCRLKVLLPGDQRYLLELSDLHVTKRRATEPQARTTYARLYCENATRNAEWDRLVSIKSFLGSWTTSISSEGTLTLRPDAIRFRIPHQYELFHLIEGSKQMLKASRQIYNNIIRHSSDYILTPKPVKAKRIPKIRLKVNALFLELGDDPFEARLFGIYRIALSEQTARLAREDAYESAIHKSDSTNTKIGPETDDAETRSSNTEATSLNRNMKPKKYHRNKFRRGGLSREESAEEAGAPHSAGQATDEASIGASRPIVTNDEAYAILQQHNSEAWIQRIRYHIAVRQERVEFLRNKVWGADKISDELASVEKILPLTTVPPLLSILLFNVDLTITPPSFPLEELPQYLHRAGSGQPLDRDYFLLIPMHLKCNLGESRMHLRDFPLPIIHFPPMHTKRRSTSWSFETDFVIAEDLESPESVHMLNVEIIPAPSKPAKSSIYTIAVPKTATPVKLYGEFVVQIYTALPTKVTWGTSIQPTWAYASKVFDTFTSPQLDLSEKLPFWDKMKLMFHVSFKLLWVGGGDVHLTFKGI